MNTKSTLVICLVMFITGFLSGFIAKYLLGVVITEHSVKCKDYEMEVNPQYAKVVKAIYQLY